MSVDSVSYDEILKLADYTGELERLRDSADDDRIDRAFSAVCKHIWGYTLDDFDDESLAAKDHAFLDRLTWKKAQTFALDNGYDLVDPATGDMVADWWGFAWMILAETRGLLTPEHRAAAWRRYETRLMEKSKVVGVSGRRA